MLLLYVDDATSRLMELRFAASGSTFDYFASTRSYLERYGKPVAFYSDKASISRVVDARGKPARGDTQFGRALSELNVDIICANTPQAKGRVERAHLTLQDRLVKELRLRSRKRTFLYVLRSLQTLRFTLFDQPARIVRPGGRPELRFAVSSVTRHAIEQAEHAINRAA